MSNDTKLRRGHYRIVGRDSRIDLDKYTVKVHGRDVIDYEKLQKEDLALYQEILKNEHEANRRDDEYLEFTLRTVRADSATRGGRQNL